MKIFFVMLFCFGMKVSESLLSVKLAKISRHYTSSVWVALSVPKMSPKCIVFNVGL